MRYCVLKDTIIVIDGSSNTDDIMIQNAVNAGFLDSEIEIITKEEFETRKTLVSQPIIPPDEVLKSKIDVITINTLIDLGVI